MPRVYIGRLSYHVCKKDVKLFFGGYGKVTEIDLKNGYGFVEFEDNRDADDAVYDLNGKKLCGEKVTVEHARGPRRDRDSYGGGGGRSSGYNSRNRGGGRDKYGPPVRTENRLIVENLSTRCSWQDLKDLMRQAGEVTYADAHKRSANEGVIEFRSYSDMKRALDELDGTDINGKKIRLIEDQPRKRRSCSGSHSRSRSRRRSRSRSSRSHSRSCSRARSRSNRSRSRSSKRSHRSRSKSGRSKSRSRNRRSRSRSHTRKSRSRSRKSRSHSGERKSKSSRSKSHSKVKSERDSRSSSKENPSEKRSRSRSASSVENGKEVHAAKSASCSPSPQAKHLRSKSVEKQSTSLSKFDSQSRSASQD
ncbi:serine/arginine-rich splicing factor 6-like [Lampris incognitus]|uniref:serine/arginine-rich splicing factor 6-like n=1 Tax=Lampris incognitus TaxID=2546036 RepID=UPI0024B4E165|nr:serine/arginine-rich splicing factor 6-like [Lampris incognitus]